jgi:peptidoglycan/LPS O-acetylase OafA/YrhL
MARDETALKIYRAGEETAAASPGDTKDAHSRSYSALRQTIGWMGLLLPAVLIVGHALLSDEYPFIHSLSRYYHTEMRNVFVGGLCAMGVFLFHYSGSDKIERWAGALAGAFALGVAFFPVAPAGEPLGPVAWAHYGCASGLFLMLAMMSLVLFGQRGESRNICKQDTSTCQIG